MPDRRDVLPFFFRRRPNARSLTNWVDLRTLTFLGIMILLIALAGSLYLRQASEVAGYAHQIRQLELEKERVHREIVALRAEVAMQGSLKRVRDEGGKMGYRLPEASRVTYQLRVELAPTATATPVTNRPPAGLPGGIGQGEPGSLLQRLMEQLRTWIESPVPSGP